MANEVLLSPIPVATADPKVAVVRPSRYEGDAIEAVGAIGGDAIRGVQQGRAENSVNKVAESFQLVGEAIQRGGTYDEESGTYSGGSVDEELNNRIANVRAGAAKEFNSIALASEQGLHAGSRQATLQIESRIRKLSAQTPGFEAEIRDTARGILGYDPTGFAIRQILDVDKPTENDPFKDNKYIKAQRDSAQWLAYNAQLSGINLDEKEIKEQSRRVADRLYKNDVITDAVREGDLNADEAVTRFLANEPSALEKLIERNNALAATGGKGFDLRDATVLRGELLNIANKTIADLIEKSSEGGVPLSPDARNSLRRDVMAQYQPLIDGAEKLTENGFLEDNLKNMTLLSQQDAWKMAPEVMYMKSAFGDTVTGIFLQLQADVINEGQLSLLYKHYPWLQQTINNNGKGKVLGDLSKRSRAIYSGSDIGDNGQSLSTGSPELDAQMDAMIIEQNFETAKKTGDKQAYQDVHDVLQVSDPEASLSVVASDPSSYTWLSPSQRTQVATQVVDSALVSAEDLASKGATLVWIPREQLIDTLTENTIGGDRRKAFKRKQYEKENPTGKFTYVTSDETGTFTLPSTLQADLDRLNDTVIPIMSDNRWRREVSGKSYEDIGQWAKEVEAASKVSALTAKLERIDRDEKEWATKTSHGSSVVSEDMRQRMLKALENQRIEAEDSLSDLVTKNRGE